MNEVRDFHPLVAEWLTGHGFEHEHHVSMPRGGETYAVECKVGTANYRSIIQLMDYQIQLGGANGMLVVDSAAFSDLLQQRCDERDVQLIVVDKKEDAIAIQDASDQDESALKIAIFQSALISTRLAYDALEFELWARDDALEKSKAAIQELLELVSEQQEMINHANSTTLVAVEQAERLVAIQKRREALQW